MGIMLSLEDDPSIWDSASISAMEHELSEATHASNEPASLMLPILLFPQAASAGARAASNPMAWDLFTRCASGARRSKYHSALLRQARFTSKFVHLAPVSRGASDGMRRASCPSIGGRPARSWARWNSRDD